MPGDEIVWPPVVVIANIPTSIDPVSKKSKGLESREILAAIKDVIQDHDYRRLIPIYNYRGQTSRAFLVFQSTEQGYENAVKVHNGFADRRKHAREVYGYLATPDDMRRLDGGKKSFKAWSVESLEKMVLQPRRDRIKAIEDAKALKLQLQQTGDAAEGVLHNESREAAALQEELARMRNELAAEEHKEMELLRKHELQMKERMAKLAAERDNYLLKYKTENKELFASLKRKREEQNAEVQKFKEEKQLLLERIGSRQNECRNLLSEKRFELKLEEQLTALKEEQHKRMMELREKFNNERMELNKKQQEKEQKLLQDRLRQKEELAQTMKLETRRECAICMETLSSTLRRALYDCGHSYVCEECLPELWKATKECPVCRHKQKKMPIVTHIYV